jgi:hypothetical protein
MVENLLKNWGVARLIFSQMAGEKEMGGGRMPSRVNGFVGRLERSVGRLQKF